MYQEIKASLKPISFNFERDNLIHNLRSAGILVPNNPSQVALEVAWGLVGDAIYFPDHAKRSLAVLKSTSWEVLSKPVVVNSPTPDCTLSDSDIPF